MKSKGSAWDVVFSDLSLNTALSALLTETHESVRFGSKNNFVGSATHAKVFCISREK